ncbi:ABC transporter substrate-binding protein [Thalassobaculum sp.]|uniref:ABC transporter substrate-binding protein n=1 Tax=Thalassobaculum sp. TaxID=2022740 RepID=UPI0032EACD76
MSAGTLSVALGTTQWTRAFKASGPVVVGVPVEFADVSPIYRAFAPMVREQRFDLSEMALFTFLQARAYDKPMVLLPVAVAARSQEPSLWCRADDGGIAGPADLAGRRVGVRAYSQTTGAWLRGVLAQDFGVKADSIRWTTFEPAHVPEYADPPWATRAPAGSDMLAMLRAGDLDAVIVGNEPPNDPALRQVFPDPEAAGARFRAAHGFVPVNHLVVARRDLVLSRPELVAGFAEALVAALQAAGAPLPVGRAALDPAIELAARWAFDQGLLPRALSVDEVWAH